MTSDLQQGPLRPSEDSDVHRGPLAPAEDSEVHRGPLAPATESEVHRGPLAPTEEAEVHRGPLAASAAAEVQRGPLKPKPERVVYRKTNRERRWLRRRRRRVFEEVVGWIMVPIILIAVYWGVKAALAALGTTPTGLYQSIQQLISSRA